MLRVFLPVFLLLAMTNLLHAAEPPREKQVQVIAHRGASALLPEHTLAAYARAIADGADVIEPDLVMTRDGVLVARHENEISGTTNVAALARFADRRTSKRIDGSDVEGWFTEDFTLAELRTLHARERLPELRGKASDGKFGVPTFGEILALVEQEFDLHGRVVGVAPELKHSTYFANHGFKLEHALVRELAARPFSRRVPVFVQSFETSGLKYLKRALGKEASNVRLVQLLGDPAHQPGDRLGSANAPTYADLARPAGLRGIAGYADAIGVPSRQVLPLDGGGKLGAPSDLVRDAHAADLQVFVYTFRPENHFLPPALWKGSDPRSRNDEGSIVEIRRHIDAGIDGFFTDDPSIGRLAVDRL